MKMSINLAEDLIKNLVTLKITKCFRLFYNDEYHFLSKETMFSKSDGNIYIQFSNNKLLAFYAYTEEFTIYMESIENDGIPNNVIDITDDVYWKEKIGQTIISTKYLFCKKNKIPYGIELYLSNKEKVSIEYSGENEYTFDALILN